MALPAKLQDLAVWAQANTRGIFYSAAGVLLLLEGIAAFFSPTGAWPLCVAAIACMAIANIDRISKPSTPSGFELLSKEAQDSVQHIDKLLRMSVRMQLVMCQRVPRWGSYSDAEMESILAELIGLLRDAGVPEEDITALRDESWDRWVRFDYVFHALGGSTVPDDPAILAEWTKLRRLDSNPTPDELDDFLKRNGAFDGLRKELAEGYRHYREHRNHLRPEVWARRNETRHIARPPAALNVVPAFGAWPDDAWPPPSDANAHAASFARPTGDRAEVGHLPVTPPVPKKSKLVISSTTSPSDTTSRSPADSRRPDPR